MHEASGPQRDVLESVRGVLGRVPVVAKARDALLAGLSSRAEADADRGGSEENRAGRGRRGARLSRVWGVA